MSERARLNTRIHSISGTEISRELNRYRREISKQSKVDERGVGHSVVISPERRFIEAADTVTLLHAWLDDRKVPSFN